ncbi:MULTISPECIES: hypothetical protein [Heyndrickxia]|nr:hypothetical protein [Heyndrickxia shackletonii]
MEKGKISSKKMEHLERKTELLDSPKKREILLMVHREFPHQ